MAYLDDFVGDWLAELDNDLRQSEPFNQVRHVSDLVTWQSSKYEQLFQNL